MTTPFDLSGKHLLITGASSGIGRATAVLCAALGAKLTINGRNTDRLNQTLQSLDGEGHSVMCCDLTDYDKTAELVKNIEKLDGAVFCTGTQKTCVAKCLDRETVNSLFETNFTATVNLNTLLFENKKINKGASLVFISSIAALGYAEVGNAAYGATKGALTAFAKVLALENVKRKIRVNTVSPAMVRTPLLEKFDVSEEQFAENEKKYPLGYGNPEDVAAAVAFLLSDGAKWITGTDLKLDGGLTLQ